MTRSRTFRSLASRSSARYALSPRSCPCSGPPAMTSSASGMSASARTATSTPWLGASGATHSSRGRSPRWATGPSGENVPVSTPRGMSRTESRRTPSRASVDISLEELASTARTLRAMTGSRRSRAAPACARGPAPGWPGPGCPRLGRVGPGGTGGHVRIRVAGLQRQEGLHDRHAQITGAGQRREPAGPEVRVGHVGRVVLPVPGQVLAELRGVRGQAVRRKLLGRPGGHVLDGDARRGLATSPAAPSSRGGRRR